MLAPSLDSRGEARHLLGAETIEGPDRLHNGLARRNRAGFVQNHRVDSGRRFKRFSTLDQNPALERRARSRT